MLLALFVLPACLALPGAAGAAPSKSPAQRPAVCDGSLRALAGHNHARVGACVVSRGRVLLETTYYQNASRVGGTALAAYPEARLRIGIADGVELFYDAPSEIARSGANGAGIYYMTPPGYGASVQLARRTNSAYLASIQYRPRLDAMAHMTVSPAWHASFAGRWSAPRWRSILGGRLDLLAYNQGGAPRTAFSLASSIERQVLQDTTLALKVRATWKPTREGSSPQTAATFGILQQIGANTMFSVEIGTAFNAAGDCKNHFLGAGFAIR